MSKNSISEFFAPYCFLGRENELGYTQAAELKLAQGICYLERFLEIAENLCMFLLSKRLKQKSFLFGWVGGIL
jgi:hypothetical protein